MHGLLAANNIEYRRIGMLCEVKLIYAIFCLKVLCDFYLCNNTMSQTPPLKVGSGQRLPALVEEKAISP